MRKQTAIWTTREGKKLRICDMTDSHLLNAIRFLERAARRKLNIEIILGYRVLSTLQGDMAQMCCEQEIDRLESVTPGDWLYENSPLFAKMLDEANRRKLVVDDL